MCVGAPADGRDTLLLRVAEYARDRSASAADTRRAVACAARLFRIPEPDDNMLPGNVASTANVRRQAADFFGHLRARAAEFPSHVALHWPPMTTPPLGTRCSWWFASQAPRGRRARLGRADEGAQPPRIAPTNENLRGVGARTAFRAEDGWFRGHSTTTDAWESFMLRPGDDWDGLGAAPHALSEPPIQGEERIVGVHAPRRAQGVCGETRRRSLFRTTKIRFYPTIFATFCFLAELGAQKGPKWALRGHQPIDFRPFRTPSRGIAAFSHHGHFRPPIAPPVPRDAENKRRRPRSHRRYIRPFQWFAGSPL